MDKNQTITEQILQLRQIEEKALANFTEAKTALYPFAAKSANSKTSSPHRETSKAKGKR